MIAEPDLKGLSIYRGGEVKSNGVDWITTSVVKAHGLGIVTDAVLVNIHELLREEFSEHQLSATALRSIAKKLILDMVPETKAKE